MTDRPVLYVITCATPAAGGVDVLIEYAQRDNWDVWVISTPNGLAFIDEAAVEELTGHPVRSEFRQPHQPKQAPKADAVIVAGASFNTINKWALGIADNLALSLLAELLGHTPIAVLPYLKDHLAANPAFERSISRLRQTGATIVMGPDTYQPHPSGTAALVLAAYPWRQALEAVTPSRLG